MSTWTLPAELTIQHAAAVHAQWCEQLPSVAGGDTACIDAGAVQAIDGAGLQLLLSLLRTLRARGAEPRLEQVGHALAAGIAAFGLAPHLSADPAGAKG
jgi:ABC-type transporter Mla MlaB component